MEHHIRLQPRRLPRFFHTRWLRKLLPTNNHSRPRDLCLRLKTYAVVFLAFYAGVQSVCAMPPDSLALDTIPAPRCESFRPMQLVVPGALVLAGSFGVRNGWMKARCRSLQKEVGRWRGSCYIKADDWLQYAPMATHAALGLFGVKAKHPFRERTAAMLTAYVTMNVIVNAMKHTVREVRPDTKTRNSFPSGHTAMAFMGAELIRSEYGTAWGAGAYVFATGIAVLRIYNNRHWLNDVLAGAGTGILCGRIGYWLLPLERRLLGWDKKAVQTVVLPSYEPALRAPCISLSATF